MLIENSPGWQVDSFGNRRVRREKGAHQHASLDGDPQEVLVEKVSVRQICRDYGLSHHAVKKMLENVEPPGYQRHEGERPRPKLGLFLGTIDQILEDDKTAPPKQCHTAKRIFKRLRDEHGSDGSESQVRAVVATLRSTSADAYVPLRQPPGEAQFGFGEAMDEIAGVH